MTNPQDATSSNALQSRNTATGELSANDVEIVQELATSFQRLREELAQVIVGQDRVIEQVTLCLLARGHALLMGVPGLAKTLLVSRLAETLSLAFRRIQFTPDLMPMDITGTDIIQQTEDGRREFQFVEGPVFANMILADEINRAPAKTQAAMLEAMQEQRVTVVGKSMDLPAPFFVLATQNPVEQEGTYPLPEAQLDRFMFLVDVDYPSRDQEVDIALRTTTESHDSLSSVLTAEDLIRFQQLVRRMPVPQHLVEFTVDLVRRTRANEGDAPDWLRPLVSWGAGPRAVQSMVLGAKARAALHGSFMVRLEDIVEVAVPVLSHRITTTFSAQSDGVTSANIIARLVREAQATL